MERILAGVAGSYSTTIYDSSGAVVTPGGAVTADVVGPDGVAISGSPFTASVDPTTHAISISLPALTLGVYDVTWHLPTPTAGTVPGEFEIVGGFLFSVKELRDYDSAFANLDAQIARDTRTEVEQRFEGWMGRAMVPRGEYESVNGTGMTTLILKHIDLRRVVSLTEDGISRTPGTDFMVRPQGILERPFGRRWSTLTPLNVIVRYEYGMDEPPKPVNRAALRYARYLLASGGALDKWERFSARQTEEGTLYAAPFSPTGLPDVDGVLADFGRQLDVPVG
jgi:hypothetical protein